MEPCKGGGGWGWVKGRDRVKGEARVGMNVRLTSRSNRMSKWDSRLLVQGSRLW